MPWIKPLEQITKNDTKEAGGKGANLGELANAKLPVPPGFIITTDSFLKFIEVNGLDKKITSIIEKTDVENNFDLLEASRTIKSMIVSSQIPKNIADEIVLYYRKLYMSDEMMQLPKSTGMLDFMKAGSDEVLVAVRSSATAEDSSTASFAGQMKTILNVHGPKQLLEAVRECWSSLFEPRAIFYRHDHNVGKQAMAVIVQKMVSADKSGVIFTANPVNGDKSKIIIEAAWGLGEAVVSGSVTPDVYIYDKATGKFETTVSRKEVMRVRDVLSGETKEMKVPDNMVEAQVLNEIEVKKLAQLSLRVEEHYGFPQDIEWCEERTRLYLVQTRPITTLSMKQEIETKISHLEPDVKGLAASPGRATGPVKLIHSMLDLDRIEKGDILVTKMTSPDMVPAMRRAAAIVTDAGGLTCHAAIVSRELGVPCVVGTKNATSVLQNNETVTVDATHGFVYKGVVEAKPEAKETEKTEAAEEQEMITITEEKTSTQIKVNLAFSERAPEAASADGVGLLRAEHMLTGSGKHPVYLAKKNPDELVEILVKEIGKIAKIFYPKPVWYRSLDARTDEFRNLEGGDKEPTEPNPMLGWHGVRRSIDDPAVLKCELYAIKKLHEAGLNNVEIMIPFVSDVIELIAVKEIFKDNGASDVKIGIMVEVPSCALTIDKFCKEGISFISFGSNDLTQLVLGVDRNNENIAKLYRENNEANWFLFKHVINVCKKHGVTTSICGEAPSRDDEVVKHLVELGIDSISVEIDAIEHVREVVAQAESQKHE